MTDDELIEELARVIEQGLAFDTEQDVYASETCVEERRCIAARILPIIKRREIEAGERVRDAAASVKQASSPAEGGETTGQWTRRTLREAIRAIDIEEVING